MTFPVIEIDEALAGIPARVDDVLFTAARNIPNCDGGSALRIWKRLTIEMEFVIVQADIAWDHSIRNDDVRVAAAIQVANSGIPRGPTRLAVRCFSAEVTVTIVQQNQLRLGRVVAQNDIEISAVRHVRKRTRVALCWLSGHSRPGSEVPFAIAE